MGQILVKSYCLLIPDLDFHTWVPISMIVEQKRKEKIEISKLEATV